MALKSVGQAKPSRTSIEAALTEAMEQVSQVITHLEKHTPFNRWAVELQWIFVLALCPPPRRHRAYAKEKQGRKGKYRLQEEIRADWCLRAFFPRPHTNSQAKALRMLGVHSQAAAWKRYGLAASELRGRIPYLDNLKLVVARGEKFELKALVDPG